MQLVFWAGSELVLGAQPTSSDESLGPSPDCSVCLVNMQAQVATEYNLFSFPASLVTVDLLSDSGTGVMTDLQWASLLRGDESYARNHGYYALLDSVRDVFERGDKPKRITTQILGGTDTDVEGMIETFLEPFEGGFVNGGPAQLARPNCFITPQGRCCEALLFSTMQEVLEARHRGQPQIEFVVPSNGAVRIRRLKLRCGVAYGVASC